MNPLPTIEMPLPAWSQALAAGATHYSPVYREFYRRCPGGIEAAGVKVDGSLDEWKWDWRFSPPESSVRL